MYQYFYWINNSCRSRIAIWSAGISMMGVAWKRKQHVCQQINCSLSCDVDWKIFVYYWSFWRLIKLIELNFVFTITQCILLHLNCFTGQTWKYWNKNNGKSSWHGQLFHFFNTSFDFTIFTLFITKLKNITIENYIFLVFSINRLPSDKTTDPYTFKKKKEFQSIL